jgi:hypothetical protein
MKLAFSLRNVLVVNLADVVLSRSELGRGSFGLVQKATVRIGGDMVQVAASMAQVASMALPPF